MALNQDSGQTPERRDEEATELMRRMLDDENLFRFSVEDLSETTRDFLGKMHGKYVRYGKLRFITPKQLYWLRDIFQNH